MLGVKGSFPHHSLAIGIDLLRGRHRDGAFVLLPTSVGSISEPKPESRVFHMGFGLHVVWIDEPGWPYVSLYSDYQSFLLLT